MDWPIVKIEPKIEPKIESIDSPVSNSKPSSASEELIGLISARPPLWNRKHMHCRNKKVVNQLWREVQEHFPEFTVGQLRKKFKNLKDNYRKELRKVITNQYENVPYSPTWSHYDQMHFLQEELLNNVSGNGNSNLTSEDPISVDDQSKDSVSEENESKNIARSPSPTNSIGSYKVMKRSHSDELDESEPKRPALKPKDGTVDDSDDYHFLMSLLPYMEELTVVQKFKIRNRINQIMIEAIANPASLDS